MSIISPDPNVVSNKIIVSNKLLGLLRLGLGLESGFILHAWNYNPNKLLELLNVVTNNFIGLQRSDRLIIYVAKCIYMCKISFNDNLVNKDTWFPQGASNS